MLDYKILPPNLNRAKDYKTDNWISDKILLPDGSVVFGRSYPQVVTDGYHYEIHMGNSFTAYFVRETAAANGHRSGIYLETPSDGDFVHMVVSYSASTAADFYICEVPTIASGVGVSWEYNLQQKQGTFAFERVS